jgi:MtN3 and saliva related transmembrane protein
MGIFKTIIEIFFSAGMFINALLFIPQVIKLLKTKDSHDLSLLTFAGFNLIQLFILLHGLIHHDYLLLAGAGLSLLTCGTITVLIIVFK